MTISPATRKRLEMQGFICTDDPDFTRVAPWLRFTPALCTATMGLGTALASPVILGVLMLIAESGAIFAVHPFDLIYNYGLRRLTGTQPLPRNGAPRRFACGMAAVWLAATVFAFGSGSTMLGYVLGSVLTAVAAVVSVSHFCVPSLIYGRLSGHRRRIRLEGRTEAIEKEI